MGLGFLTPAIVINRVAGRIEDTFSGYCPKLASLEYNSEEYVISQIHGDKSVYRNSKQSIIDSPSANHYDFVHDPEPKNHPNPQKPYIMQSYWTR